MKTVKNWLNDPSLYLFTDRYMAQIELSFKNNDFVEQATNLSSVYVTKEFWSFSWDQMRHYKFSSEEKRAIIASWVMLLGFVAFIILLRLL